MSIIRKIFTDRKVACAGGATVLFSTSTFLSMHFAHINFSRIEGGYYCSTTFDGLAGIYTTACFGWFTVKSGLLFMKLLRRV